MDALTSLFLTVFFFENLFLIDLMFYDPTLAQTRNLLRIAIFNISYIRGLFPEKYFNDKSVPALGKLLLVLL